MGYGDSLPDHKENTAYLLEQQRKSNRTMFIVIGLFLLFPVLLIGVGFWAISLKQKPEYESLEAAIKSTGTTIRESNSCDENVFGYYEFETKRGWFTKSEVVICTNNFNKAWDGYPRLLKHEMTHIMQACLGTTINSPDEIRELRLQLKNNNEKLYRNVHGSYEESDHLHEIEAHWMELQDYVYVNKQLQKYCG